MSAFVQEVNREVVRHVRRVQKGAREVQKLFMRYEEPYCEISQDPRCFLITLRLPGVHKKDIFLRIENKMVEIKGMKKEVVDGRVQVSGFARRIEMPDDVLTEKARAVLHHGLLKVRIPKRASVSAP